MKPLLLTLLFAFALLLLSLSASGQRNVGREYGNPKTPILLTHLAEKNRGMLSKGNIPRHSVLGVILCFKWACRNQARRNKSLHTISFTKFQKLIRKNARKGAYKKTKSDSIRRKTVIKMQPQKAVKPDTITAPSKEPKVNAPVLKADSLIILSEVLFETNSATLRSEQFSALDSIMDFLLAHPSLIIKISGHTDNTGRESHNQTLSTKRAEVVAEYLIGNGVTEGRVTFLGFGSSKPLLPNDTKEGRSKNRRVELLIHDNIEK